MATDPRAALRAFSDKDLDVHRLVRALVEHEGWMVPALLLTEHLGVEEFEEVTMFGDQTAIPPGEVWLFTDAGAALAAQQAGGRVGAVEGGLWGGDLFAAWDPAWGTIEINPGSPAAETLTLQPEGADLLTMWASVVRLERCFASGAEVDDDELLDELLAFRDFLVLVDTATNEPVSYQDREWRSALVVCTAPDNADDFVDVFAGNRGAFRTVSVPAEKLLAIVRQFDMDAIAFNPHAHRPGWVCPAAALLERVG